MQTMLFVANWKMEKSFAASIDFCTTHKDGLASLAAHVGIELVICPSFPALFSLNELLNDTMIHMGAQTCSAHKSGPYTGQVSAQSLKEAGCNYCIVGHSEQRQYAGVTDQDVANQANNLCDQEIEPVICIGENKEAFDTNQTLSVIEKQLDPVLAKLKNTKHSVTIAYEPIWAIGTGIVPPADYLDKLFEHINTILAKVHTGPYRLIYGGSVSEKTIPSFKQIPLLTGFLIGGASLDFQKFEKIVSLGK